MHGRDQTMNQAYRLDEGLTLDLTFADSENRFVKLPHQRAKTDHLEGDAPHVATDSAETFYTSRNRVRSSGE